MCFMRLVIDKSKLEHLAGTLSNSAWRERINRSNASIEAEYAIAAKGGPSQGDLSPCACGCEAPVASGRVFINRDHQREWMKSGGASALAHQFWRANKR
jgi:hypothetical protein